MAEKPASFKIYPAILAIMQELGGEGIGKDRRNKEQGFNFRGIEDVMNALTPLLVKHKVILVPRFETHHQTERESKKGGYLSDVIVKGHFDWIHVEDGSMVTSVTFGEGMDSADKATNKAMSGAFKYASLFGFVIPTEGVIDDTDDAHEEARGRRERSREPEPERGRDRDDRRPPRNERADSRDDRRPPRDDRGRGRDDEPGDRGVPAGYDDPPPERGSRERERPRQERQGPPQRNEMPGSERLTPIPENEVDQPLTWRVENVWPILLDDIRKANDAELLKAAYARAYDWAKKLPNDQVSRNLLAGCTDEYQKGKKELNIG